MADAPRGPVLLGHRDQVPESPSQNGKIKGAPDPDSGRGDWVFDRLSLDAYREGQMLEPTVREKALAIMRGIRL